jgi:hypothetical protein
MDVLNAMAVDVEHLARGPAAHALRNRHRIHLDGDQTGFPHSQRDAHRHGCGPFHLLDSTTPDFYFYFGSLHL